MLRVTDLGALLAPSLPDAVRFPTQDTGARALADDLDWEGTRLGGELPGAYPGFVVETPGGGRLVVRRAGLGALRFQAVPASAPPRGLGAPAGLAARLVDEARAEAAARRSRGGLARGVACLDVRGCFGGSADPVVYRAGLLGFGRGWARWRGPEVAAMLSAWYGPGEGRLYDPARQAFWEQGGRRP